MSGVPRFHCCVMSCDKKVAQVWLRNQACFSGCRAAAASASAARERLVVIRYVSDGRIRPWAFQSGLCVVTASLIGTTNAS